MQHSVLFKQTLSVNVLMQSTTTAFSKDCRSDCTGYRHVQACTCLSTHHQVTHMSWPGHHVISHAHKASSLMSLVCASAPASLHARVPTPSSDLQQCRGTPSSPTLHLISTELLSPDTALMLKQAGQPQYVSGLAVYSSVVLRSVNFSVHILSSSQSCCSLIICTNTDSQWNIEYGRENSSCF